VSEERQREVQARRRARCIQDEAKELTAKASRLFLALPSLDYRHVEPIEYDEAGNLLESLRGLNDTFEEILLRTEK